MNKHLPPSSPAGSIFIHIADADQNLNFECLPFNRQKGTNIWIEWNIIPQQEKAKKQNKYFVIQTFKTIGDCNLGKPAATFTDAGDGRECWKQDKIPDGEWNADWQAVRGLYL